MDAEALFWSFAKMRLCLPRIPNKIGSRMNCNASATAAAGWRPAKAIFGIALLAGTILPAARLHAESANADYKRGQQAEARQDYDAAFEFYQKAQQRNPQDLRFRTAFDRVRTSDSNLHLSKGRNLFRQGDLEGALAEFLHASEIDPGNEAAEQEIVKVRRAQGIQQQPTIEATPQPAGEQQQLDEMGSPIELTPVSNEPLTLHMNEDSKVIYQAIGKAAGVNVLFDPDYTSKRIQVDLNNVTLLDALRIVGAMSNTFWRPITSNTIFVAANTRVKRTELDEQAVQTFYLTNAWQQNDLNDVQTALRNVLPNAKVYGVASQNAIVMRGTPDELLLAEKLINDLDKPRSEVVVDFGILEVSKNWERTLGIAWPQSFGVQLLPPNTTGTTSTTTTTSTTGTTTSSNCNAAGTCLTLSNIAHLNSNDFAVTVGSATLNLLLTDSDTQILQDPRVRATDGQKATLTIGSKIPIATGSYQTGAATALVSSLVNTQFQYIDVGAKIEMTPTVHFDDDVTLKVHVEISSESGNVNISGVTEPILSQRIVDQVIRLREGEASILGGINESQDSTSWTGLPGVSSIPILKYLFGSKDHTITDDEIVFVVVPHVVRGPDLNEANLRAIDVGEGQAIDLRHVAVPNAQNMSPAPHPATLTQPNYGSVPAGSAPAAAMQALSQMRSNAENMETPPPVAHPASPVPPVNPANPLPPAGTGTIPAAPPAVTAPPTLEAPPVTAPPAAGQAQAAPAAPSGFNLRFVPPSATVANGANFQVPIQLNEGADISSVPLQFRYDPAHLTLVNVTGGDLLSKDGQAMALIHRDDGPGNVTVVASRPPGTAGVSGSGTLCVLTFTAKTPGPTTLTMTRAGAVNSKQEQANAPSTQAEIVVK
jgi:general secretion pathway protein D